MKHSSPASNERRNPPYRVPKRVSAALLVTALGVVPALDAISNSEKKAHSSPVVSNADEEQAPPTTIARARSGDSVWSLQARELGPGHSQKEIRDAVDVAVELNRSPDNPTGDKVFPGDRVILIDNPDHIPSED